MVHFGEISLPEAQALTQNHVFVARVLLASLQGHWESVRAVLTTFATSCRGDERFGSLADIAAVAASLIETGPDATRDHTVTQFTAMLQAELAKKEEGA